MAHTKETFTTEPKPEIEHANLEPARSADERKEGAGQTLVAKALIDSTPKDADLGAKWLATYTGPRPEITDDDNNKVRNKIDKWMLPLVFLIYFNQQQDKSSVSLAAVFDLREDANLQGQEYAWLTTIIYVAQLIFQPLSVYALVRFPINWWIMFCFAGWSSSCMILAAFQSFPGLVAFRFFLGAFEASIAPTMMILVSAWWSRREQPLRNNVWYSANGIAIIMGSLIAWGFARVGGYIFLFNGAFGLVSIIPVYFFLPSHITTAKFLSDEQKWFALERIRMNQTGTQSTTFKWSHVKEAFLDLKQWIFVGMIFCISLVSGGISAFGPIVIRDFGFDPSTTILFNMIPGAIGIVSNILAAYGVIKLKYKSLVIGFVLAFPVAGAAGLYAVPHGPGQQGKQLALYFILQVFQCITPLFFSWTFANTAGHTKKTTTTALLFIGLCAGNMVGPQLYFPNEAPRYQTGLIANMVCMIACAGLVIIQVFYLMLLNKRNIKRRAALGKTGPHVDYSLEASSKWAAMREANKAKNAEGKGEEGENENENEQAFADLTDLKNEDFIYSL